MTADYGHLLCILYFCLTLTLLLFKGVRQKTVSELPMVGVNEAGEPIGRREAEEEVHVFASTNMTSKPQTLQPPAAPVASQTVTEDYQVTASLHYIPRTLYSTFWLYLFSSYPSA